MTMTDYKNLRDMAVVKRELETMNEDDLKYLHRGLSPDSLLDDDIDKIIKELMTDCPEQLQKALIEGQYGELDFDIHSNYNDEEIKALYKAICEPMSIDTMRNYLLENVFKAHEYIMQINSDKIN